MLTNQLSLFDRLDEPIPFRDPSLLDDEKPRLSQHHESILCRLREGPATGPELQAVSGNRYGARLHEIARAGYSWEKKRIKLGVWLYWLLENPPKEGQ